MKKGMLQQAVVGQMHTNCYLLTNGETNETLIVDPGSEGEKIAGFCRDEKLTVAAILLTHGHFDHIGGVAAIRDAFRAPVYASVMEEELLADPSLNLSGDYMGRRLFLSAQKLLADGEEIALAGFSIRAIHTPGHTGGGMSYYLPEEGILFSGDTLFRFTYGRTDLPTSSHAALQRSICDKLFALPEDTVVYPGHGEATTIGEEKRDNPIREF